MAPNNSQPSTPGLPEGIVKENIKGFWESSFVQTITAAIAKIVYGDVNATESFTETHQDVDTINTGHVQAGRVSLNLVASSDRSTVITGTRTVTITGGDSDDQENQNGKSRKVTFFRGSQGNGGGGKK